MFHVYVRNHFFSEGIEKRPLEYHISWLFQIVPQCLYLIMLLFSILMFIGG